MAKINISMDDKLLERLDRVADACYTSRSGLISIACTQYINTNEMIIAIKDMSVLMRKIADKGTVDQEDRDRLEDLERVCKLFTQN